MTYENNRLSVLSYADGFTLWRYKTDDLVSDIGQPSYFNKASNMFRAGDMILCKTKNESGILLVISSGENHVEVKPMIGSLEMTTQPPAFTPQQFQDALDEFSQNDWRDFIHIEKIRAALQQCAKGCDEHNPDIYETVRFKPDENNISPLSWEMHDAFWKAFKEANEHHGQFESTNIGFIAMIAAHRTQKGG